MNSKTFTIIDETFIEQKQLRVLTLDAPILLAGYRRARIDGNEYPFFFEHDNPCGLGIREDPRLPTSLKGRRIQFIEKE